jgi:hypothetical protein
MNWPWLPNPTSRSDTGTGPSGERVEVGTVVHEGREYRAYGMVIDHKRGRVTAYIGFDPDPNGYYPVTTWDGEVIGRVRVVSSWSVPGPEGSRMYAYRGAIENIPYSGRGQGPGMVAHFKRTRR